jgi:hypothetical protein
MIYSDSPETPLPREFPLTTITSEQLGSVLDWIYKTVSGEQAVNADNALEVFEYAHEFQIDSLVDPSVQVLKATKSTKNCVVFMQAGDLYCNDELRKDMFDFVLR